MNADIITRTSVENFDLKGILRKQTKVFRKKRIPMSFSKTPQDNRLLHQRKVTFNPNPSVLESAQKDKVVTDSRITAFSLTGIKSGLILGKKAEERYNNFLSSSRKNSVRKETKIRARFCRRCMKEIIRLINREKKGKASYLKEEIKYKDTQQILTTLLNNDVINKYQYDFLKNIHRSSDYRKHCIETGVLEKEWEPFIRGNPLDLEGFDYLLK